MEHHKILGVLFIFYSLPHTACAGFVALVILAAHGGFYPYLWLIRPGLASAPQMLKPPKQAR